MLNKQKNNMKNRMFKIVAVLLVLISILTAFAIPVFADNDEETGKETCSLTVKLSGINDSKVDNVIFRFKGKDVPGYINVTFKKDEDYETTIDIPAGTYSIDYVDGDNDREPVLTANTISVPDATSAKAELEVKKINNNSFFISFLRNNTFTLILLLASIIAYFIFKKKRENAYLPTGDEE